MKLAENMKIVPVAKALDVSSGATNAGDSINMKNFHHATFIVLTGTMGGADTHVKVNSGATAGAATSALTFNYAFGGAAVGTAVAGSTASCDVLAATASSADLSITHGTYDDWMLVVEVDASKMDIANGEEWHPKWTLPTVKNG